MRQELSEKNEIIEKMPKQNSEELFQKQRELTNAKIQENFNLKNVIDQQKADMDKLKKKIEAHQDMQTNKQMEIDQLSSEYKNLQQTFGIRQKQDTQLQNQIIQQKEQIRKLESERTLQDEKIGQLQRELNEPSIGSPDRRAGTRQGKADSGNIIAHRMQDPGDHERYSNKGRTTNQDMYHAVSPNRGPRDYVRSHNNS